MKENGQGEREHSLEGQGRGVGQPPLRGISRGGWGLSIGVNGQAYNESPFKGTRQEGEGTLHDLETGEPP